eukprot:5748215-Pyramimonas_sp.AAC.1
MGERSTSPPSREGGGLRREKAKISKASTPRGLAGFPFGSLWDLSWGRPGALLGVRGGFLGCLLALLNRFGALLGASRAVLDVVTA